MRVTRTVAKAVNSGAFDHQFGIAPRTAAAAQKAHETTSEPGALKAVRNTSTTTHCASCLARAAVFLFVQDADGNVSRRTATCRRHEALWRRRLSAAPEPPRERCGYCGRPVKTRAPGRGNDAQGRTAVYHKADSPYGPAVPGKTRCPGTGSETIESRAERLRSA